MLLLWRLYRAGHGLGLDGFGATLANGRWHNQGDRVVYFGASPAITVLERLAHIDGDLLPADLRLARFEVPDEIPVSDAPELPANWVQDEVATRRIGAQWWLDGYSCLLRVPSAILPEEFNLVFNPQHPGAKLLRFAGERPFRFDPRLL